MSGIQRFHALIAFVLLLEFAWCRTAMAQAAPEDPSADVHAAYREVITNAVAEFDAGRIAEARALFLRAHELWPSARTLRTLGMTAFDLHMYPRALEELQSALDDARRPLPDDQRVQVASLLEQTRSFVGRYRVHVSPPEAELWVDAGASPAPNPLVLGVGDHTLIVRAQGYVEMRRSLVVQGREDEDLTLSLEPAVPAVASVPLPSVTPMVHELASAKVVAPSAHSERTPVYIAFGVGVAGLAVGSISGLIAFGDKRDADPSAGHRAADISTTAFITAGVAIAIGTALLIVASSPNTPNDETARASEAKSRVVRPVIGLATLGVECPL